MRAPLTSIKAFVRDAENLGTAGEGPAVDDPRLSQWLLVAQAAERLAELKSAQRIEYAQMLTTSVLPMRAGRPTQIEGDGRVPVDAVAELAERLRLEAEDMERAGCFELALTTVSSVCQMLARGSLTARMLATAHLGRVTRQIGELDSAVDCYTTVTKSGLAVNDGPVAAHGFIGLGNIAHSRGNRPDQKAHFLRALELAARGSPVELSAHQGLMVTANQVGDLADALLHGWCVHDLVAPDSEVRFETLTNLAVSALKGGFFEASLSGFEYVIQRTSLSRLRIPAIGGGMCAASLKGAPERVVELEQLGRAEVKHASLPLESAKFFFAAAEAHRNLGDEASVSALIASSLELANVFGFHELRVRAENFLETKPSRTLSRATRSTFIADERDPLVRDGIGRLTALSYA